MVFGTVAARGTLTRLDRAFQGFYRRCRQGAKAGFPRFKGAGRFDTVSYEDAGSGWKLKENDRRLYLQGVGHIKVRLHRRVRAVHRRIANRRRDTHHQLSRRLVDTYDTLVFEDLAIANMVRSAQGSIAAPGHHVAAKAGLNREIHSAGWGQLLAMVAYKAEEAGRDLILVAARNTSRRCPDCGHVAAENRCSQAVFRCQACGHAAHADVNAATNILRAGQAQRQKREVETHAP